jgi:hypothetical protein
MMNKSGLVFIDNGQHFGAPLTSYSIAIVIIDSRAKVEIV